jgi:hypothetical protein
MDLPSQIEPIPLPDVLRPAKLAFLPQWLEARCERLRTETQPDKCGRYRQVPVLPRDQIPTSTEACWISKHGAALDNALAMTPEAGYQHAEQTALAIGKMLLSLPSREGGEMAMEAKSEAYMAALDDLPFWAVQEAVRRWYRGDCDKKHDCRWQPAPAVLRELAFMEFSRVRSVRRKLTKLLEAEPLIEFDQAHSESMKARVDAAGLLRTR